MLTDPASLGPIASSLTTCAAVARCSKNSRFAIQERPTFDRFRITRLVDTGMCAVIRLWPDPPNQLPWPPANTLPEDHDYRLAPYLDWLATRPGMERRPMPG